MEPSGYGVTAAAELSTRVQYGQNDLDCWFLFNWVHINGNPSTVVAYPYRSLFGDRDIYVVAVAGKSLIDRIVDYFIDQVVQAPGASRTDIHTRSFSDRFKPFEDLDIAGIIFSFFFRHIKFLPFRVSSTEMRPLDRLRFGFANP